MDDILHPLTRFRRQEKLTLAQLAGRLGTSKATISRLETGKQKPSFDLAMRIKTETGVSWEEFAQAQGDAA